MDLMKTLLIYMSATMTLAVQSTSAPQVTPTPSPVPVETAIVEQVDNPGEAEITMIPEITPEPKETMTPFPVPQITPNTKAYHNLGMGGKGKEVKRLQEKLIELGYLKGTADGAYGRQTYNAVKKFQYYNGLKADGVAGRATQTYLFENPDIVPNPEVQGVEGAQAEPEVTPAPETEAPVTEAPETEAPTEAPTEEPTPEPTQEPTAAPEVTEAPATEAPEPAEPTEEPEPDVVENVDLDADVYEPIVAKVALNEGKGPLEFEKMEGGVLVKSKPRLTRNGTKIRVSLDDLCAAVEGWQLTDEGAGSVVLEAAGYTLALYNEDKGSSATVDGTGIEMKADDFDFNEDGHFINAEFLAKALNGEAFWDQDENTLMLRIPDKEPGGSVD
jgi:peptidoglycan hydrolase-like protein with peptidoglycan-binding domain